MIFGAVSFVRVARGLIARFHGGGFFAPRWREHFAFREKRR